MAKRKTPRPAAAAKAVERRITKAQAADKVKRHRWNWITAEVVFSFAEDITNIVITKAQFPEKTDFRTFPIHRVQRLLNAAAVQVRDTFPQERHESFKVHDAFLLNIAPLGEMTDEEFWGRQATGEPEKALVDVVAALATAAPDNVVPIAGTMTPEASNE